MMTMSKTLHKTSLAKLVVPIFLLVLVAVGAVPHYLGFGQSWVEPPPVETLSQLRDLRETGLELPEWTMKRSPYQAQLGAGEWTIQDIEAQQLQHPDGKSARAVLMLLPQKHHDHQPQVEWTDINGFQSWQTDSYRRLKFAASAPSDRTAKVNARFFRAWGDRQTYAVVQWYAWPEGGHSDLGHWFWSDRKARLSGDRMPWVAVSLLILTEPLGDIEAVRPLAESLAQTVQAELMAGALRQSS
jgi:cyanoexosortase B-associated protein